MFSINYRNAKPRRILMTADARGGMWTYVMSLAAEMALQDTQVIIATLGPELSPGQKLEAAAVSNVRLFESDFPLEGTTENWEDTDDVARWLLSIDAQTSPDLVHQNHLSIGAPAWSAPMVLAPHCCSTTRAERLGIVLPDRNRNALRRRTQEALRRADMVIASSWAEMSALEEGHESVPNRRVIPNGCDFSLFKPLQKENGILSVGSLNDHGRNLWMLRPLAESLGWPMALAGESRSTQEGVGSLQILGRLPREEWATLLGRASIFVLPTRDEPFGFSVLEAAACGCALVLGDIPSMRETWDDAAIYVDPDDLEGFDREIRSLIQDEDFLRKMGGKARSRAFRYAGRRCAMHYYTTYQELLFRLAERASGDGHPKNMVA